MQQPLTIGLKSLKFWSNTRLMQAPSFESRKYFRIIACASDVAFHSRTLTRSSLYFMRTHVCEFASIGLPLNLVCSASQAQHQRLIQTIPKYMLYCSTLQLRERGILKHPFTACDAMQNLQR